MRPSMSFQYQDFGFGSQQPHQYDLSVTTAQQQPEKSIFDTDIENADDTTITLTSIADVEARDRDHAGRGMFDHDAISQDWDASVLSESDHPIDRNDYYGAEEAVKTPAKAPRHRRKTVVPLAETEDINYANVYKGNDRRQTLEWDPAEIPRSATAASNKRNSISRIPRAKSRMSLQRSDSDPGLRSARMASTKEAATTANTRTVQIPYRTGYSKASNFPQSLATTPNNRFNFKSERSYERLISQQTSPTRQVSGPRPQPDSRRQQQQRQRQQRRVSSASPQKSGRSGQKYQATPSNKARRLLDETDDSFDDDEEAEEETQEISVDIDDESSGSSVNAQSLTTTDITQRKLSLSIITSSESIDKRYQKLASDYPDEVLQQMDFSELEKEPFDHSPGSNSPLKDQRITTTTPKKSRAPSPPPPPSPPAPPPPPPDTSTSPSEKLAYIMTALRNPTARQTYISSMPITDWELLGDELIDQMGEMLKMIKDSRQARRRTTALFEAEIRRRHDQTINEAGELDRKFVEMKEGGLGVLRALNP
ncbi:uncharacterized protein BHQ10_006187 [Talaromyces amestolkiae]|uniref:Extracellular mutant protein 11 C-terminal domain-containing protein n=1 Tax=Talaromyces amestolkiae TaxID=1196081 RepID=A0A364L2Y7_TALAM|nr:uncharacterized protein BHQ10_006187 [Talaromyces amestolkiae]RAO70175.1 hypothetical protein BHQ10_006187 [Talaromyces amestolkiae]